jgi:hypothetical protein
MLEGRNKHEFETEQLIKSTLNIFFFAAHVAPVCLPQPSEERSSLTSNGEMIAIGWGGDGKAS